MILLFVIEELRKACIRTYGGTAAGRDSWFIRMIKW